MKNIAVLLFTLAALSARSAHAADFITTYRDCVINWTQGSIISAANAAVETDSGGQPVDFSDGSPLSLNRARADAAVRAKETGMENVMAAIRTVRIDGDMRMKDLIATDDFTQKRLSETLSSYAKFRTYPRGHGGAVCEVSLRLGDVVASLPHAFPRTEFPVIDDSPLKSDYTSLIIDCRGLGMEPMIFPSVYNDEGLEIYGREFIDSTVASKYGVAAYCGNEDDAKALKRAGARPLFTVALKSVRGGPVISNRDTRRILGSDATRNNLKKCRVIIILDRNMTAASRNP